MDFSRPLELSAAIEGAGIDDLNNIFDRIVDVKLGYYNDQVSVEGYTGTVTTDVIARKIMKLGFVNTLESKRLANSLTEKVFKPLKELVEAPENYYSLYQITALTRIAWTPDPEEEFGKSVALKHAMALGFLTGGPFF